MILRAFPSFPRIGFRAGPLFRPRFFGGPARFGWRGFGPRRFGFVGARPWRWGGGYRPWFRGSAFAPWARRPYWGGGYRPWFRSGLSPWWRRRFGGPAWVPVPGFPPPAPWMIGQPPGWMPPVEAAPPPEAPVEAPPPEAIGAPPPEAPPPDASAAPPPAAGAPPEGGAAASQGGAPAAESAPGKSGKGGKGGKEGELPQAVSDGGQRIPIHWDESTRELGEVAPPGGGVYVVYREGRPETAHITSDFRADVARRYGGGTEALRSHAAEGDGEEHMYYYGRRRYGRGRRSFMFGRLGRFGRSGRWARIRILRALRRQMAMNQPDDQGDDDDQSSDMGADQG
jgi:hypothetical protein